PDLVRGALRWIVRTGFEPARKDDPERGFAPHPVLFRSISSELRRRLVARCVVLARKRSTRRRLLLDLRLIAALGRTAMARLAALAADRGHVRAVRAHGFAALAAGFACFVGRKLVGGTQPMGGASTQARDASLLLGIHRSESAAAGF